MPDAAPVPADLAALKRAQMDATEALHALPQDAPPDERAGLRQAEHEALQALLAHPAYSETHWRDLYTAATGD